MDSNVSAPDAQSAGAVSHERLANAIRFLAIDAVEAAKSGHPGMPMGMADIATVLFGRYLRFDPSTPRWPDRDRFVLSNGHGSMLLYALLYLTGYADATIDELKAFRQLGSRTAGHPEYGHLSGIETTTGPLGQGLATAVGMALAEKMLAARYGQDLVDHHTYVFAGDGCLMEGISQEAISFAGHQRLSKLIVFFDDNRISIDGDTALSTSEDHRKRFEAVNWHTQAIDGHDAEAIAEAIEAARGDRRPSLIACRTRIGFGAPTLEGTAKTHGAPLGAEEIAGARERLGWPYPPFEVPDDVLGAWRALGARGRQARVQWEGRLAAAPAEISGRFLAETGGAVDKAALDAAVADFKTRLVADKPAVATRRSSQMALEAIKDVVPNLIGGSADLTGSNLTLVKGMEPVSDDNPGGRYIYFGIREHGMAAALNGIALHGGLIPYGGSFFCFTDYCKPAIRLSALMGLRVIYVMTHDSIGLGEDGPTHQPVEHLIALRAVPNLNVFRPCDAVEALECWQYAIEAEKTPSILALSRQNLPLLRETADAANISARGGYVLRPASGPRQATLMASGSEVEIAVKAGKLLADRGVRTAVVSMPCLDLFDAQPKAYRDEVLGPETVRVAVEAASPLSWMKYASDPDAVVGLNEFGASAPADALYTHFGITADAVAEKVLERL